jgi:hypothetical protein
LIQDTLRMDFARKVFIAKGLILKSSIEKSYGVSDRL